MFQDVGVAPVAKDDSFTLVQEGLAHFLKNKYYHHGIRGEKFRERFIHVVSNIRTNELSCTDPSLLTFTSYFVISTELLGALQLTVNDASAVRDVDTSDGASGGLMFVVTVFSLLHAPHPPAFSARTRIVYSVPALKSLTVADLLFLVVVPLLCTDPFFLTSYLYCVIGTELLGALQLTVNDASPMLDGDGSGGADGVVVTVAASLQSLHPPAFSARTRIVYSVPALRPLTSIDIVVPSRVHSYVAPSFSTSYFVIGTELLGALQLTVNDASPMLDGDGSGGADGV
eukprot:g1556.t1